MDYRPPRPDQPYAWDDERLSAYLDGELSAPEQAQLEARLVVDPELRQLVDELRAVRQQLEVLPEYRLKPTFADQVLRRAEQEMLLSPRAGETMESAPSPTASLAAATPAATAAAAVQPAVITLPARTPSRRWQRGAIWTAIAAAAVLLLIVTNRPNAPQQEHVARNDVPDPALAKPSSEKDQADPAGSDKTLHKQNAIAAKESEQEGLAKAGERESQPLPLGQEAPSVSTVVGDANGKKSAANQAGALGATATMPKPETAVDMKRDATQMARGTGGNNSNANQRRDEISQADLAMNPNAGAPGKPLLKSQAPSQRKGFQEKQAAAPRPQLSPQLTALLASDEFSRLASSSESSVDHPEEDQVLVVYMTPSDALSRESSFASMLEKNSIGLAEKTLIPMDEKQRERSFAFTKPGDRDAKSLAKADAKDELEAGANDRKAMETRDFGKAESPSNGAMLRKEAAPGPASDSFAQANKPVLANELYYLEADASQVDELLRQLQSSSTSLTRLNIAPRSLKLAKNGTQTQNEQYNDSKPAAALPQAAQVFGDDSRAEGIPLAGKQQDANQQSGDANQLTQGTALAPPTVPIAPTGAVPSAAAAPAATATEPFAPPTPVVPKEIAADPAPAALTLDLPAATEGATTLSDTKGGFGQSNSGAITNRRANQADKASQQGAGDRAIAYRLRGVESLLPAMKAEPAVEAAEGDGLSGGGGGVAIAGKAEIDTHRSKAAAKQGNSANAPEPAKTSDAQSQLKSEGGARPLDATTTQAKSGDALPAGQPLTNAPQKSSPGYSVQEKKMEQSRPRADLSSAPASAPMPSEAQQRQSERAKAAANAEESTPSESSAVAAAPASAVIRSSEPAEKSAAETAAPISATKRVRVLFVIEHETQQE